MKTKQLHFRRNVCPDSLDLRDRPYLPSIAITPPPALQPSILLPVLQQGHTSACTGFALASVVNHLLRRAAPRPKHVNTQVSPFMLYSMARRYDDIPGQPDLDTGSSLRGAMKGWFKHGVCRLQLWDQLPMPPPSADPSTDWWQDAVLRPLGAYYRVDAHSITDMHVALNEVGILYASAVCHDGWNLKKTTAPAIPTIPLTNSDPDASGHAFAIVGYDSEGFLIQNSWGPAWGANGLARLTYEDWNRNAMDCWVAQLGVVTAQHEELSASASLRYHQGKVRVSSVPALRLREYSPFIIDMERGGRLSDTGKFRTSTEDIDALFRIHLPAARAKWNLPAGQPVDVAIYAHGGLTGEEAAFETAAQWIPALYDARVFPIFLMWESDIVSTIHNRLANLIASFTKPTGGFVDAALAYWNRRVERTCAPLGTVLWDEMKLAAKALTAEPESGGVKLFEAAARAHLAPADVRLHLIGHSAGSIVHCHLVQALAANDWSFQSVNFMAPAVTVSTFESTLLPALQKGSVRRLNTFHLSDCAEQADPTCRPILGYRRSLLYLVSESFEHGIQTPILGMQKYFDASLGRLNLPHVRAFVSPGEHSCSSTHGGFDDDPVTRASVIRLITTGEV